MVQRQIGAGLLIAAVLCTVPASGQGQPSISAVERRITALSARFRPLLEAQGPARFAGMDALAEQIHGEIDRYIANTVTPKSPGSRQIALAGDLKIILAGAGDLEVPPIVLAPRSTSDALVVAYTLHKGGWHGDGATSFRLRAYRATGDRFALADAAGHDLDGYGGNSALMLRSTGPEEAWFVVNGQMTGANGPNIRMRAYMYKGGRFTTMWMPANAWGDFTVTVTDHGFTVDGPYYRSESRRHDVLSVSPGYISVAGGSTGPSSRTDSR